MRKTIHMLLGTMLLVSISSTADGDSSKEAAWIEVGKDAVRSRLKDPQSAQFRNTFFNYATLEGKRIPVSCGQVNARNSFGGYTGFKRYVSAGEGLTFLESDVSDFENVWNTLCGKY